MSKKRLGLLLILLAIVLAFFCHTPQPSSAYAEMTIQFLGMTNRPGAGKEVIFKLSNQGHLPLTVFQGIDIEYRAAPFVGPVVGGRSGELMAVLTPGQLVTIQFSPPHLDRTWRPVLRFAPGDLSERMPPGRWDRIKAGLFHRLGLKSSKVRNNALPLVSVRCNWID